MKLDIYQVDAFTSEVFGGNPAAVIPLDEWLPDDVMLKIAIENNLSETAFFIPEGKAYHLRWFTPGDEVNLCGHATLASAFILFDQLGYTGNSIKFKSLSGDLFVQKSDKGLTLNFPVWKRIKTKTPEIVTQALGKAPLEFYEGPDCMAVYEETQEIHNMQPDFRLLKDFDSTRGVIVTAPGDNGYDFISRAFFPNLNIDEDPVTGSAHCILTPYWAERLEKTRLKAHQASKRGGDLLCELKGDRIHISGNAVLYMKGQIYV